MRHLFLFTVVIITLLIPSKTKARELDDETPTMRNYEGEDLTLFTFLSQVFGGTFQYRSNHHALSISMHLTPAYVLSLLSDEIQLQDSAFAAAVAYAFEIDPKHWVAYAFGDDVDEHLLHLLSYGPDADAMTLLEENDGKWKGEAMAKAQSNFLSFSRAFVHLIDEASKEGVDLVARSEANGDAISIKFRDRDTLQRLFSQMHDRYTTKANVVAIVDPNVADDIASAHQIVHSTTDSDEGIENTAISSAKGVVFNKKPEFESN